MKAKLTAMLLAACAMLGAWAEASAHERVQLWEGGPYWATTNIGAENPEDYGLYFWWGDTTGFSLSGTTFDSSNCPTYNKSIETLQSEGWIVSKDGTNVLAPSHDAAHVKWGGSWRMPTYQELSDLYNKCDWSWKQMNGVNGWVVSGRGAYSSNSIFLPAAGSSLSYAGSGGSYWSSVPYPDYDYATELHFSSCCRYMDYSSRYGGRSVRPVHGFGTSTPTPAPSLCYQMLNEDEITEPYAAPNVVKLAGAVYSGCDVVGIVELKLGKVNVKKGSSKVSGSVTTLDGKKYAAKGVAVTGIDGTTPATVSFDVKGLGTLAVTIGGEQFAGSLGGTYHVQTADVGGAWAGGSAVAAVEPGDLSVFTGTVLSEFLPTNEVVEVSGGKWKFAKAASVKWAKPKGASEKELIVDTSKGKNLSGLKLTYTPKKGTFKGSFNVYALEGPGSATKLQKYKLNVSGVVVGGVGYGVATCKKPSLTWSVMVE